MQPLWLQIVVGLCAVIGAVLSIFNFVRNWARERERVEVYLGSAADGSPALVVVNHSSFAIEIKAVGHSLGGSEAPLSLDRILHPYEVPKVIAARSEFCFSLSPMDTLHRHNEIRDYFYARTATGSIYTTETRMKRWARRAAEYFKRGGHTRQY